jgi:hypothetical protein
VTIYVKDTRTGFQKVLLDANSAVAAHEAAPDPHPQYAVDGHTHAQLHDAVTVSDTDTIDLTVTGQQVSGSVKQQMSISSDASGLKLVNDSSSPGATKLYGTNGSGVKGWYDQPAGGAGGAREIRITIDGNGSPLSLGVPDSYYRVAVAGTISEWYITGYPSGSVVIDLIKAANAIPVAANSMTGGTDRPSLSSATVNSDTNVTGWTTTSLSVGDVLGVNVISCSTITNAVITLKVI